MNNKTIITLTSLVVVAGLVFLFAGNQNNKPINEPDKVEEIGEEKIINYLKDSGIVKANHNGEVFADYHEFERTQDKIFIWGYIMEYSFDNKLEQESGVSLPLVLNVSEGKITGHDQPRDGSYFAQDIRKMFPEELHEDVLNFHTKHKQELNNLINSVGEKAKQQLNQKFDRQITVGGTTTVELEANRTTGYEWHYDIDNENIIKVTTDNYEVDEHPEGMTGVGGTRRITIKGIKKGITTIRFEYYRSWTPEEVEETKEFKIKVGKAPNYQFPEQLKADYISAQDWKVEVIKDETEYPEKFEVTEKGITCEERKLETDLPGRIHPEVIDGKSYCIETKSEGAAGTTYTEYSYSTLKDNNLVTISFLAKYSNCGNFSEPERTECENERETFEFDQVISEIINSN